MRSCKDGFGMSFEEDPVNFNKLDEELTPAEIEEARLDMLYGAWGPSIITESLSEEEADNLSDYATELSEEREESHNYDDYDELDQRD